MAKDELVNLRNFLKGLESPLTKLRHAGKDIKPREIAVLKREIALGIAAGRSAPELEKQPA
jgi:hypothetical protein